MAHRLAIASSIILFITAPALAQSPEPEQAVQGVELELGGGWMLADPFGVADLEGPGGPTVDVALTRWAGRTGLTVGVTSIFGYQDGDAPWDRYPHGPPPTVITPVPHVYPHVGWRRRWMNADGRGFLHVGIGGGPLIQRDRILPGRYLLDAWPAWHVEVMATQALRHGLSIRFGGDSIQWLFVPLTLRGSARLVWEF